MLTWKLSAKLVIIFCLSIIFPINVSFREYYVFVSNAAATTAYNFVVSAITFEGFKLRSSNLTHALLIQISRTSSIFDIVIPSKNGRRRPLCQKYSTKKVAYRSEMTRNAIESDFRTSRNVIQSEFRTSKMPDGSHFVKHLKTKQSCVSI